MSAYRERTNADRANDARIAFDASKHAKEDNDELTNLYDLVCDLLHLADTLETVWARAESSGNGDFVLDMAAMHYHAELRGE